MPQPGTQTRYPDDPEARGLEPHGFSQDQQRARPSTVGKAHG